MKTGDFVKFKDEKKKVKYGVILHKYNEKYHIRGIKPKRYYLLEKKDLKLIGGLER